MIATRFDSCKINFHDRKRELNFCKDDTVVTLISPVAVYTSTLT